MTNGVYTQFTSFQTKAWAELRNECTLSEVLEMVRQDLVAEDNDHLALVCETLVLALKNRKTFIKKKIVLPML
jgi:hypothetical protein